MIELSASTKTKRLVGYFPSWAIHAQNYHVADIPADQLTHVIYAFADVSTKGVCASVNAQDDQVNFPQLLQLKKQHPEVMALISVGGASSFLRPIRLRGAQLTRGQGGHNALHVQLELGSVGCDALATGLRRLRPARKHHDH